jgi:Transcription elongation factor, GreA/GreB, C-term
MTVTVRFVGDGDEVTFLLVSNAESDSPMDVYHPCSPLGRAISGKKVGEPATYTLRSGRVVTVEILESSSSSPQSARGSSPWSAPVSTGKNGNWPAGGTSRILL